MCAQKHFKAAGVDYRFVDDKDDKWYEGEEEDYGAILFDTMHDKGPHNGENGKM